MADRRASWGLSWRPGLQLGGLLGWRACRRTLALNLGVPRRVPPPPALW